MLYNPHYRSPQVRHRYQNALYAARPKAPIESGRDSISTRNRRRHAPLLSPILVEALTELTAVEHLPVATLIAPLINEALTRRLWGQP